MKKFLKKLGKGCGYVVLYLLVAVGTAAGILFLSPAGNQRASANEIPVQLQQLWQNLQAQNAIAIDLDAQVNDAKISLNAQLDLSNGFDKLKVQANAKIDLGDEKFDAELFCGDGEIFLQLLNGKFKMKTNSIGDAIGKVTSLLGVEMPDLGGIDLSSLDADMILGFLSDLTETKNKDGVKLAIEISMLDPAIELELFCDNDYNLQKIELPQTSISGTSFSVSAAVDCPEKIKLETPKQTGFIDISDLMDMASIALDTLKTDTLGFDVDVTLQDGTAISGNFSADLKNLNAMFETEIMDLPLKIAVYKESMFYLEFGNVYLKFSFADADDLTRFLKTQFDISVPVESITQILAAIQEKEILKILPALSFGNKTSVDQIDLSILAALSHKDDKYVITLRDIGEIVMLTNENKLSSVSFEGLGVCANVKIVPAKEVQIADKEYADLDGIIHIADAFMNTFKQDVISGKAEIHIGEIPVYVDFKFENATKKLDLQIRTKPADKWLTLRYNEEKLYLSTLGVETYFEKEQTENLLKLIASNLASQDKEELVAKIKSLLDPQLYEQLFTNWENDYFSHITIGLLDKVFVDFEYEEVAVDGEYLEFLKSLNVEIDDISALIQFDVEPEFMDICESEYENADKLINNVSNLNRYAEAGEYFISLDANSEDFAATGFADYDEKGLSAELNLFVFGQEMKIRVVKSEIFLDLKGLHLKTDISNWKELLAVVSEEFDVDFNKLLEKYNLDMAKLEKLLSGKFDIDIQKLLKSPQLANLLSKLWIELENGNLKVTYDNFVASLNFLGEKEFGLNFSFGDFSGTLKTKPERSQISPFEENVEYVEVSEVLRKAGAVLDYVKGGKYYVTLSGGYDGLVSFDGVLNFDEEGLEAEFNILAYGQSAKLRVLDKKIYLDFKDVHLFADIKDWKTLLGVVGEEFDIGFEKLLGKFNLDIDTLDKILSGEEKFDFKKLTAGKEIDISDFLSKLGLSFADDILSITYQNVKADVKFVGKMISYADVSFQDFDGHVEIKDKANTISPLKQNVTYNEVSEVLRKAGAVLDYVKGGKYYVTLSGDYDGIVSFDGVLNFDEDGLEAEFNILAYGQNGKIRVFGKKIYVDVEDVNIVADISNWRDILNLVEGAFNLDFEKLVQKLDETKDFSKQKIEKLLSKIGLCYEDGKLVVQYTGLTATVNFDEQHMISSVDVSFDKFSASVKVETVKQDVTKIGETVYQPIENVLSKAASVYQYVTDKKFYISDIKLTIDEKYTISGFVNFDSENGLSASLATRINNVDISAKILDNTIYLQVANLHLKFEIADIETVLYFLRNEFKIDFVEQYAKYKWLVDALTIEKDLNFNQLSKLGNGKPADIEGILKKLWLSIKGDTLTATFSNPSLVAQLNFLDEKLSTISLQMDKFVLSANLQAKQDVQLGEETYFDLVDILPIVSSIKEYVLGKKFDITANADVFEGQTKIYEAKDIVLQVDATKKLQFYADAHVAGVKDTKSAGFDLKLNAAMYKDFLYFDYNNLCLKLNTAGVQDILSIVCEIFGIDPAILSIITGEQSESSGIDLSSMSGLLTRVLPGLDTTNPFGLLNIVNSFSMTSNMLDIELDGRLMSNSEGAKNMHIQIFIDEMNTLEKVVIQNLYTGVTANEHFYLEIFFNELQNVTAPDMDKAYVDLTGAEELIKALINTVSHKTFELTGQLMVKFGISGKDVKDWYVPVKIQAKFTNGKPEVYAQIGEIPVPALGAINNDTPWTLPTIENRMLYIYYRDGYVYFYRYETRQRGDSYEKRIISSLDTVMNDVLYFVKWGTGFEPFIMEEIRKSLSIEHTVDLGNVLNSFSKPTAQNSNYEISLNMKEISGDKNMGDMKIGIGLGKFEKQVDDDKIEQTVVGNLTFELNMPFTDTLQLYLKSANSNNTDNLYLELDKDMDEAFAEYKQTYSEATYNNGKKFLPDIPYDAQNGEWFPQSEREFTVTFETGRSELSENPVKGVKDTAFELPKYTQIFEDVVYDESGAVKEKTKYRFAGWFTDANFASGSEFKEGKIPSKNITIYGKWEMVEGETWRTVYYLDTDGTLKATQYAFVGSELRQDIENMGIERTKDESDGFQYAVEFDGCWEDETGGLHTVVPDYSINLKPHYKPDPSLILYTLTFETGFGPNLHSIQFFGNTEDIRGQSSAFDRYGSELSNNNIYEASEDMSYRFEGWFFDQEFEKPYDFKMPAEDLTIYAKWTEILEWKFQIYDNGVALLQENLMLKKSTKILPYSADKVAGENEFMLTENVRIKTSEDVQRGDDSATEWYLDYEDGKYSEKTTLPDKMTNHDLILHIRNKYRVQYSYYELENVTEQYFAENAGVENKGYDIVIATISGQKTFDKYLWQNEEFDLQQTEIHADSYQAGTKTLYKRVEFKFKYSNGMTSGKIKTPNQDLNFSSEIVSNNVRDWHYISFDVSFVYPSDWKDNNSDILGKITKHKDPTELAPVPVLHGDEFDAANFESTAEYSYKGAFVSKHYYFKTVTWTDESSAKCITDGIGTYNKSYTVLPMFNVNDNKTLHAVWGV